MTRRALVVRPEPGCTATAARIDARDGWHAVKLPLTERRATGAPRPEGAFAAIALTSAAAVLHVPPELRSLPVHAIGDATARAARAAGMEVATVGAGDGTQFGENLVRARIAGPILYPCAEDRRPGFEDALVGAGVRVDPWPVYRTVTLPDGGPRLAAVGRKIDAVLLYAPSGARALGSAARDAGTTLSGSRMLCLSAAIAQALPPSLGAARIWPNEPREDALLDLLDR